MDERTSEPSSRALRTLMRERGIIDAIELSGIAEVSASTVSLYLSGRRGREINSRSVRTVEKLAVALNVKPEYFLEVRQMKAQRLVAGAMAAGRIDLEDVERLAGE
ncbi:MAG: helix-turn-helix transcriptional regulator [candidate division NC10 bacterium]|nr:helix-turn-helix transcriptional regulator [Thermoleophilia bacterium]NJD68811.1 helix-turn-helix transcriptional regulator [candidate division NC10 bacterium]